MLFPSLKNNGLIDFQEKLLGIILRQRIQFVQELLDTLTEVNATMEATIKLLVKKRVSTLFGGAKSYPKMDRMIT